MNTRKSRAAGGRVRTGLTLLQFRDKPAVREWLNTLAQAVTVAATAWGLIDGQKAAAVGLVVSAVLGIHRANLR